MTTLDRLSAGSEALLLDIGGARSFQRRLMELGLLPGTRIRLVRCHDLGGVMELEVRAARVALRKGEAGQLRVALG